MPSESEADALAAVAAALGELGVRWYLMGAQAAIVYGVTRFTADIDATAKLDVRDRPSAAPSKTALQASAMPSEPSFAGS